MYAYLSDLYVHIMEKGQKEERLVTDSARVANYESEGEIILYQPDNVIRIEVRLEDGTV